MREFILIMPELVLALTLAFVVLAEITYHQEEVRWVLPTALTGLGAALVETLIVYQTEPEQIFHRVLSVDGFSLFFKLLFIILAALAIVFAHQAKDIEPERRTEFSALVLAGTLAMSLAASSCDLVLTFLSLQFLNVVAHFIAGYGKRSILSIEAGVKYMILSGAAGALLIYGFALLFSATHSLNLQDIHQSLLTHPPTRTMLLVIFMLIFMALGFQIGAFPMYQWAPDVIEGAPTPASGFLSVGLRAVGFAVALRVFTVIFAQPSLAGEGQWQVLGALDWTPIIGLVAGLTMVAGSFLALRQKGAKRMVGCIVINQTGLSLLGLLVLDQVGMAALLYNLAVEVFALMGTFYVLSYFAEQQGSDRLEDLKGILGKAVPECICLVIFLLCLVGVPPAPGFIGKFTLIGAAVKHQWLPLAVVAVLSMALSTVAIARLAFHLIGDLDRSSREAALVVEPRRKIFLAALFLPVVFFGIFAESVLNLAGKSLGFILW